MGMVLNVVVVVDDVLVVVSFIVVAVGVAGWDTDIPREA